MAAAAAAALNGGRAACLPAANLTLLRAASCLLQGVFHVHAEANVAGVNSRACKAFRHWQRQGIQEHRQGRLFETCR